jgi:hypothetical protein
MASRVARLLSLGLLAGLAACGDESATTSSGTGGGMGAAGGGATSSAGGVGGVAVTTSIGGGGAGLPTGPHLVLPDVVSLPYVVAGTGGSSIGATIVNDGDAELSSLSLELTGDASLSVDPGPTVLAPGESHELTFHFAGAATETIVSATLEASHAGGSATARVFAVAGAPSLGVSSWESIDGAGGVHLGDGAAVSMPTAPFPNGGAPYDDDSVYLFLPDGLRERGAQELVVHFHGWNTTVAETLASHRYREHLHASGTNAILVVPQGPVDAPSGDFGKLMAPGGLAALLREVLVVLYREGRIARPELGHLTLTSHSGGYQVVAANLRAASEAPPVDTVLLFDSLYGDLDAYQGHVQSGGWLRSNYTPSGGTLDDNQAFGAWLDAQGIAWADQATQRSWRDSPIVVYPADTTHSGSTRLDGAYGEELRWALGTSRRGPRIELREAALAGSEATVRWLAPPDEDADAIVVERSTDGVDWTVAATVAPNVEQASFPSSAACRVRVRASMPGLAETLASDVVRIAPAPTVLVVDGFDRLLDGSFGGLAHDFAARVGEAAGAVATVSNEAVTEDGFALAGWPVVLWLLGDESTADRALSAAEQTALLDYVDSGGVLVLSGSEAAWSLASDAAGAYFLSHVFGADYAADDAATLEVSGVGALGALGTFGFGGPGAAYEEDYPDVLSVAGGGEELLRYATGGSAAIGVAGSGVLVGFPLELVDDESVLDALVAELLAFSTGS